MRLAARALCIVALVGAPTAAAAGVRVVVDKASQRMSVAVDGRPLYLWPVSTGLRGSGTPSGQFRPQWMARTYFSRKYYNAPMPHSIFFHHGYAIHGTDQLHRLGGPASRGCVRLHPRNAATLFALVQRYGMRNTRIIIADRIALEPPARHSQARTEAEIGAMRDRLLLAEQIERQAALAEMERLRARDALRRMQVPRAARSEPAVAIGVERQEGPPLRRSAPERRRSQSTPLPHRPTPAAAGRPARISLETGESRSRIPMR
jgi:hypothetical protein